ncbi:hypothetical protein Ancab_011232, partial [Ancistrocladus abbreviatus]
SPLSIGNTSYYQLNNNKGTLNLSDQSISVSFVQDSNPTPKQDHTQRPLMVDSRVADTQSGMKMETNGRATSNLDCFGNYTNAPPAVAANEGETRGLTGTSAGRS